MCLNDIKNKQESKNIINNLEIDKDGYITVYKEVKERWNGYFSVFSSN